MGVLEDARLAVQAGRVVEGVGLLEASGDADCLVELAFWNLQARGIPRDLARARTLFGMAAEAGHAQARMVHLSLIANGTGGPPDFASAVRMLEAMDDESARRQLQLLTDMSIDEHGDPHAVPEGNLVGSTPEAHVFRRLFTPEECRFLIEAAEPAFHRAPVGHVGSGGRLMVNQVRTCDVAAFPWVAETPVIHALNRRIAKVAQTSVRNGEPLQILRYGQGQEFKPHRDCTEDRENQRILTMLVYLNAGYTGGETLFLKSGLKVRGETGDGLLFRNAAPDGTPDMDSLHAGLPVLSGEKLIASRWIRQKPFGPLPSTGNDPA
jgi:prolyl 4-hydroxylase